MLCRGAGTALDDADDGAAAAAARKYDLGWTPGWGEATGLVDAGGRAEVGNGCLVEAADEYDRLAPGGGVAEADVEATGVSSAAAKAAAAWFCVRHPTHPEKETRVTRERGREHSDNQQMWT